MMLDLANPYQSYTYAYPHKTAYRALAPMPLEQVWAAEPPQTFLYVHIPFCEMRCGFCNLFTSVNPAQSLESGFVAALERQAATVREALPKQQIVRAALGGGTPTFLSPADLSRVLAVLADFGVGQTTPLSFETSPATATAERLALLHDFGANRASIGVQSFLEIETKAVGRVQHRAEVFAALERLKAFATLNIDLIYGLPGQTAQTWLESLQTALEFAPEELFLYPLYSRPLTGLDGRFAHGDQRLELYRLGRDFLLERGYTQHSMRVFRAAHAPDRDNGTVFDAQADGLLGLGVGARSYTQNLHYASQYAVAQVGVKAIIKDYNQRQAEDFSVVNHGMVLNQDEQKRRFVLQAIFNVAGVSSFAYQARFASALADDFPVLQGLLETGILELAGDVYRLTELGLAYSDAVGVLFYSQAVQTRSQGYEWH
jgi:oxygen-independent coproporphyrinogen III oxidase